MIEFPHDIAKEVIGALMVAAATFLGKKVEKFAKDLNCLFTRVRKIEDLLKIEDAHKNGGCDK